MSKMVITREDLKTMYYEHIEAEKQRLAKLVEEDLNQIIREILNENKYGKTNYKRKCFEYQEEYIGVLLTRLQEIFIDSKISTTFITDDGPQKYVLVSLDWKN